MGDSIYGELAWDAEMEEWTTLIPIPELAAFNASAERAVLDRFSRSMGLDEEASSAEADTFLPGRFPLAIHNRMHHTEPVESQREAITFFSAHRKEVVDLVLKAILKWYHSWSDESRAEAVDLEESPEDIEDLYPQIDEPAGLQSLIELESLIVHESSRSGVSDLGFAFRTCWDDEHGLGVLVNRQKLINVGLADVASGDRYETFLDGNVWKLAPVASP